MIHDQDHHVHGTPILSTTSQLPLINLDKCFDIEPTPNLPPLPPSFIVNSSLVFDNQYPTMEFLNSYDQNILTPENYDIIPFNLGDERNTIELTTNITQAIINSNDLNPTTNSQTDYLETFMTNFPSSSSSPSSPLVLPQFVVSSKV